MLTWRAPNPGVLVAERLGIAPSEQVYSAVGGNMPQSILHDTARAVAAGRLDVALVVGAECGYTRAAAQKAGVRLPWPHQPSDTTPVPVPFGHDRAPATDLEMARGVLLPIHAYPLFENALRGAHGWTVEEHRARIGRIWSRFSAVAADNPHAWIREPKTAAEIVDPTPSNRWVAYPYTKLCTANLQVDQAAAYICCSVEAARAAGVDEDRWVFPLSGADAHDHWFISERPELHRSPAIRLAGRRALALAAATITQVGPVDLYSCFPCVVQIAATELGLDPDDPGRPLTVTGGLTFGGGPGNNYTAHGIATMVGRLRAAPGTVGLVTGLGWYATKHAVGVYASRPPDHDGRDGFRWEDVQDEVDRRPTCRTDDAAEGAVTVETYTVTFDRDGNPDRAIVVCRTRDGRRAWANVPDADARAALVAEDGVGRTGTLAPGGALTLR
jgi:acetyl-CoA C-acetyltransferase